MGVNLPGFFKKILRGYEEEKRRLPSASALPACIVSFKLACGKNVRFDCRRRFRSSGRRIRLHLEANRRRLSCEAGAGGNEKTQFVVFAAQGLRPTLEIPPFGRQKLGRDVQGRGISRVG